MTQRALLFSSLFSLLFSSSPSRADDLSKSVTFYASFDESYDADFGSGDRRMYTTLTREMEDAKLGMNREDVSIDRDGGKYGGALKFAEKVDPLLLYKVEGNVDYEKADWSGTMSFWIRLDPEEDLKPGYCDPILLTDKSWDDACFFVDFSKDDVPRKFRGGFFCDKSVWNPKGLPWDEVPEKEQPFMVVDNPPFDHEEWTHVAMTFSNINTGEKNGSIKLYMNGELKSSMEGREQTFTWDTEKAWIKIGYNLIGWFDELAFFDRELSSEEIGELHRRSEDLSSGFGK
ncbi:MAG: hypothetical protein KC964_27250 [Candidatus Omnitrophica bacterium]|nr:hypothetical protein [Candidatus Omnitrophota bacterium]